MYNHRSLIYLFSLFTMLITCQQGVAQDSVDYEMGTNKKVNSISTKLEQSYRSNDEPNIAKNYEELAETFSKQLDYLKAEDYYKKSLAIYTKLKRKEDKARVSRNLAKVQEEQGKTNDAIKNYELAKEESIDKTGNTINSNDANRLLNSTNQAVQTSYSNSNIQIFKNKGDKQEVVDAYIQQAKSNIQQKDNTSALGNYNDALNYTDKNSVEQIKIKDELANLYLENNNTDKAKEIKNELIADAQQAKDANTEITQKQSLATIYFSEKNNTQAILLLQESYDKAIESFNTMEAKKSLEALIKYYQEVGDYKKSIELYGQFFKILEHLVKSDSSLVDIKLLAATEEKISQLEKEKGLQDQLIEKKNTFNYMLIGGIFLAFTFLAFLIKAFYSVKTKNKEIALQSLRREMNPHFIFNSLNSVNQFIAENNELEANKYLSSYSNLMRQTMENSNKDFISLSNEIELIKKYLDLEHLRFKEKFDYQLIIDEKIDTETTLVPNMIIQPQLENAIWHGLRYKEEKGILEIKFSLEDKNICIEISDDGIGLKKSKELKTLNQKSHESRGLNNTLERIKLLNQLYHKNIQLKISEKTEKGSSGTIVKILFPLIYKT
ncbi:MAG: regulator of cell autolysis [Bacteroidetes bacterium RIFCSPLOWO2_12_FULL_35_15]|nr:MAG: regulator of cell autolysis [Bacteroidetes bacterium RIFCSPLOWO2_12_FULL_35_15]